MEEIRNGGILIKTTDENAATKLREDANKILHKQYEVIPYKNGKSSDKNNKRRQKL